MRSVVPRRSSADEVLLDVVRLADVEHLDDVRMAQLRHGLRLGVEARDDLLRVAQVRVDDLDRDLAPEAPVARAVHRGHPAVANLLEDLVLGELGEPGPRERRSPPSCQSPVVSGRAALEAQALQAAPQRALAQAERAGGARLVAVGAGEDLREDLLLELVERRALVGQLEDD